MSYEFNIIDMIAGPLDDAGLATRPDAELVIRPLENCARFSLRISKTHLEEAAKALTQDIPVVIGEMSSTVRKKVLCLGPDEWLILAPEDERGAIIASFDRLSEQTHHSLVDVSHRTTGIEISGPAAALVLNVGCPLDLDNFPVGGCSRTLLDKAQIVLIKLDEENYQLDVLRSFAEFTWNFLSIAEREFGASIR